MMLRERPILRVCVRVKLTESAKQCMRQLLFMLLLPLSLFPDVVPVISLATYGYPTETAS